MYCLCDVGWVRGAGDDAVAASWFAIGVWVAQKIDRPEETAEYAVFSGRFVLGRTSGCPGTGEGIGFGTGLGVRRRFGTSGGLGIRGGHGKGFGARCSFGGGVTLGARRSFGTGGGLGIR